MLVLRPGVDGGVAAIVAVVAQRGRDERVGRQVVDVELAVGPDLGVAEVVVAVGPGAVRVRPEVVERRDVLGGVAAGRAARGRALDVAPGGSAGHAHLPEDVVVGRSARRRRVAVVHRARVVHAAGLADVLREAVLRGVGLGPVAEERALRGERMQIGHGGRREAQADVGPGAVLEREDHDVLVVRGRRRGGAANAGSAAAAARAGAACRPAALLRRPSRRCRSIRRCHRSRRCRSPAGSSSTFRRDRTCRCRTCCARRASDRPGSRSCSYFHRSKRRSSKRRRPRWSRQSSEIAIDS